MRHLHFVAMTTLLASCGANPRPVEVRTVTVDRLVSTPCVTKDQVPQMPAEVGPLLNGDARHDSAVLAASLLRSRGELEKSIALLTGCSHN